MINDLIHFWIHDLHACNIDDENKDVESLEDVKKVVNNM